MRFMKRAVQAVAILAAAGLVALTWARLNGGSDGPTAAVSPEGWVTWRAVEERDIGRFVLFGVAEEGVTALELQFRGQTGGVHLNPDGAFQYVVPHHARVAGAVPFAILAFGESGLLEERVDLGLR